MTQTYTYQTLKSAPHALFFLFSLLFSGGYAQVFPVQGSLQIAPPYSPFLTDYTAPGSQKLTLLLRSNDATLGDHPIRLRLVIEGVGITLRTKSGYIPPSPLTLMGGGAPTILYGEDLLDYFNPNNLDFAGFSQRDFQTSAKLPEGVYRFSFEVFDYHRQLPLSNKIMIVAWIVLNDPPLLNLPRNNTTVSLTDPTNIVFSWTPRHTASPNAAFSTDYVFKLVEIWPANRNPYDAFLSQPPLYETTLTENQLLYGPAEPALIAGRKYAWQVQARDENGRDIFKNQGKSEVFLFQFGDALSAPENLHKEGDHAQTLTLLWEPPVKGQTPSQYNLRYKTVSGDKWQEINTDKEWVTLINLQPNTDYEAQARSHREDIYSDYTTLLRLKTAEKAAEFTCGQPPPLPKLDKTTRLLRLNLGDIFTCNDWRIVVTEITRSAAGEYTGKGMMAVKLFNGASINVTFHGAINADYQLITGGVESIYNQDSKMALVVEEMKRIGEKKKAQPEEVATDTTLVSLVAFPGKIDSVYFDKDKKEVVVVDTEGKKTSYPQKINPATQEPKIMQITDAAGNTVIVGKDGTVAKGVASGGAGGNSTADLQINLLIKEILVSFSKDINDYLGEKPPTGKGPSAYFDYIGKPACLPDDPDALRNIRTYSNQLQASTSQLNQFTKTICDKEENRAYLNDLVKKTLTAYNQKKSYKKALSAEEYEKVREMTCPYLVKMDFKKLSGSYTVYVNDSIMTNEKVLVKTSKRNKLYVKYKPAAGDTVKSIYAKVVYKPIWRATYISSPVTTWYILKVNTKMELPLDSLPEGKYLVLLRGKGQGGSIDTVMFYLQNKKYDFACTVCYRDLSITLDKLNIIFNNDKITQTHAEHFNDALKGGGFTTCKRQAHFFSQVAIESADFTAFEEDYRYQLLIIYRTFGYQSNDSYKILYSQEFWDKNKHLDYIGSTLCAHLFNNKKDTAEITDKTNRYIGEGSIIKTWKGDSIIFPKSFKKDTTGTYSKHTIRDAKTCGQNLFNLVYKDKNGNDSNGDGWNYRGRGALQVTGKANYRAVSKKANSVFREQFNWENNPEALKSDPKAVVYSAVAWFLNQPAFTPISNLDSKTPNQVTRIVNAAQKQAAERLNKYNKLMNNPQLYSCTKK